MSQDRIAPGSLAELRVLIALLRARDDFREGRDLDWDHVLELLERSIGMDAIRDAFTELLDDESTLLDADQRGYAGAAVPISLDRDEFGQVSIGVFLSEIDGAQLSYVLGVARRHELEVREESRWLRLSPQLIATEDETVNEPEEALA
jgi:hypothetical protein